MTCKTQESRKTLVCPSCQTPLRVRVTKNELTTCPNCGDWLVLRGKMRRELERFQEDVEFDVDMGDEFGDPLAIVGY
jgi:predicted RNA-binding Zn-ribbon protein involved in translation (DUF1610 family)